MCERKLKEYFSRVVAGFVFRGLAHGIYVISADTLIEEALKAYQRGEVSQKSTIISINTLVTFNIYSCFYVRNVLVCRHVALKVCLSPVTMCLKSLQVTEEQNKKTEPLSSSAKPKPG